jgi:predicted RNase H-like HicB family nuclease
LPFDAELGRFAFGKAVIGVCFVGDVGDISVTAEFTAVFRRVPVGYIAFVEELREANTQGTTLEEARENLREAVQLVLEANRALAEL